MTLRYSIDPADTDGGMTTAAIEQETDGFATAARAEGRVRADEWMQKNGGPQTTGHHIAHASIISGFRQGAEWARSLESSDAEVENPAISSSDHSITYDLRYPGNGRLECHAAPDAICHASFDCDCEFYHDYHVVDGAPHHYSTYEDGYSVRGHHVGRFDPDECSLEPWHENSDEDVVGTVRVTVEPDWHEDYVEFKAVAAVVEPRADA